MSTDIKLTENAVDWGRISSRFSQALHEIYKEPGRCTDAYAEALRRAFDYTAAGEQGLGGRALSYEHLGNGLGLVTQAEADFIRDGHTIIDRLNREAAEKKVEEMRAEVARVYREAAKDIAGMLRERCNDRTVPSRYRREGVAWAADLIDPAVPKDQYGRVVQPATQDAGGDA
jgi:hypothetical protein